MTDPTGHTPDGRSDTAGLEDLIRSTEGLQPWRRLFHAFNGVAVWAAVEVLGLPIAWTVGILAVAFVLLAGLDLLRLRLPRANEAFFRAFRLLASPREATGPASSTWYALAMLLALVVFPAREALSGILVLALADPAASYLGRRWGRRPFLGGSVEGTAVFVAVSLAILLARHPLPVAVPAAVAAALAERRSWPLDDNLAVPLATGAVLTLLGMVL